MKKLYYLLAAATMMVTLASCDDMEPSMPTAVKGYWIPDVTTYFVNGEWVAYYYTPYLAQLNALNAIYIDGKKVHVGSEAYEYTIKNKKMIFKDLGAGQTNRSMYLYPSSLMETIQYETSQSVTFPDGKSAVGIDISKTFYVKISDFDVDGKTFDFASGDIWYGYDKVYNIPKSYDLGFANTVKFNDSKISIGGVTDATYTVKNGLMEANTSSGSTNDVYAYLNADTKELVVLLRLPSETSFEDGDGDKYVFDHYRLVYKEK